MDRIPALHTPRMFAVIPAAGLSRRMGRPKLLLSLGGQTIMARLVQAVQASEVSRTVVVARSDDAGLHTEVTNAGGCLVIPESDPPDMRTSVEHALDWIRRECSPQAGDAWMLIPADHPVLSTSVIKHLCQAWRESVPGILVPLCANRRGHPTVFRWTLADEIPKLPNERGLNFLVRQYSSEVLELPVEDPAVLTDLNTPVDYERLRKQFD